MHRSMIAGVFAVAALALAGCSGTGNFDVQQTEPFRVQLEGEPQTVVVSESDSEPKQVVVATCNDPCADSDEPQQVNVKVLVTPAHADACVVKVIIKDQDTGEVLDEREVDTGGSSPGSTSTVTQTETQTVTETQTASSGTGVTQNFFVTVKGNHNIVVLTQAIQGTANVDVSASHASGQGTADSGDDGSTTTVSATSSSSSSSTSATGTSSTSSTYTG